MLIESMSTKDALTIALAAVGAVLGVINTWKGYDKDRPKLRLVPKAGFYVTTVGGASEQFLCFDVTNLSSFPLTVAEVGVTYWWSRKRGVIIQPIIHDGGGFPRKLEARTSFTAHASPGAVLKRNVRRAYVKTACGLVFKATSPALRELIRRGNA